MRRYIALILTTLMCLSLLIFVAGCSEKNTDIAFVTSLDLSDANASAANCLNGVVSYSDLNKLSYKQYSGECEDQIKKAVDDGVEVIVLFGVDDENVVYSCAGKYPDIKFVCIDFGNDFLVRPNVTCFNIIHSQYAVYAGYSAVKEGNLILGVQGDETAETVNYIRGIVEGAQIAAVEIGVKKNPVQIYYSISGSDMLAERTASWVENGCKVVFCTERTYKAVAENVTDTDICKIIALGADRTNESENTVASAYGDYSEIIFSLLETAFNGTFEGGMMFSAGADYGAAGFSYNSSDFDILTDSDITTLTQTISESAMTDYTSYKTPSDKGYSKIVLTEVGIIDKTDEKE